MQRCGDGSGRLLDEEGSVLITAPVPALMDYNGLISIEKTCTESEEMTFSQTQLTLTLSRLQF